MPKHRLSTDKEVETQQEWKVGRRACQASVLNIKCATYALPPMPRPQQTSPGGHAVLSHSSLRLFPVHTMGEGLQSQNSFKPAPQTSELARQRAKKGNMGLSIDHGEPYIFQLLPPTKIHPLVNNDTLMRLWICSQAPLAGRPYLKEIRMGVFLGSLIFPPMSSRSPTIS